MTDATTENILARDIAHRLAAGCQFGIAGRAKHSSLCTAVTEAIVDFATAHAAKERARAVKIGKGRMATCESARLGEQKSDGFGDGPNYWAARWDEAMVITRAIEMQDEDYKNEAAIRSRSTP